MVSHWVYGGACQCENGMGLEFFFLFVELFFLSLLKLFLFALFEVLFFFLLLFTLFEVFFLLLLSFFSTGGVDGMVARLTRRSAECVHCVRVRPTIA